MYYLTCKQCGSQFSKRRVREDDPKFCSRKCYMIVLRAKHNKPAPVIEHPQHDLCNWKTITIIGLFIAATLFFVVKR
jgi:endogenous inhibitor of DNA gyrase (YacG/DUF329 family)